MRCLALAEGFRARGFRPTFLTQSDPAWLRPVERRGFDWERIPGGLGLDGELAPLARIQDANAVAGLVVDGYGFTVDYFVGLRALRPHWVLAYIDDLGQSFPEVDLVVNQSLGARAADYAYRAAGRPLQVLVGPRYALLRSEFREQTRLGPCDRPTVSRVLVTLGGTDAANHTLRILRAIDALRLDAELHAVLGPGFRHHGEVAAFAADRPHVRIHGDVADMYGLMRDMDLAISGAGMTLLELCYVGLPSIVLKLAENQRRGAAEADALGCAVSLDPSEPLNPDALGSTVRRLVSSPTERARMAQRAFELVDGRGVDRVVDAFRGLVMVDQPAPGGQR